MKQRLTKRLIDSLAYPDYYAKNRRFVVMDEALTGLGIRVYPSGKKTFILRYKNEEGRDRLQTLGEFGPLTVAMARDLAKVKLAEVIQGADPVEDSRNRRRDTLTFQELGELFIEEWSKPRNKTWETDQDRLDRYLNPEMGNRKVTGLTVRDFSALHRKIGEKHPYEANRVRALASSVINHGIREGLLPDDFDNPVAKVKKYDEKSRDRVFTKAELKALWSAIDEEPSQYVRAAFKIAFLTAARRSEVLNLKWEDVDLVEKTAHFPETKNGRSHTVPLSSLAVEILESLERREGNPYVFCGRRLGQPLTTWKNRWKKVIERADVRDARPHDLRRTAASWIGEFPSVSELAIIQLLNHSVKGVTGIYVRFTGVPDEVRTAVDRLGQLTSEILVG